jgi:dTDP-4-dehydrorhamnose reductase|tara:strand:- start:3226 stop:4077 length:852 start_codon:yes stop_codon:yes gene_type:complete
MRVLVTGANGQLGQEFKNNVSNSNHKFYFTNVSELDITKKKEILDYVTIHKIELIINCAAYTNVDNAEINKRQAIKVNSDAVKNLIEICEEKKLKMIHFSTDYVYNSDNLNPINEGSNINPINYYGISKREGERIIEKSSSDSIIIRISWLYSMYGNNFVKNMIQKGENGDKIYVINDQFGCPTYSKDLVDCTINIIDSNKFNKHKVYNFSNEGFTNWFEFTKKIFELKKITCDIVPVDSNSYETTATRPKFSVTDKSRIKDIFNLKIRSWDEALEEFIVNYQ